MTCIPGYQSADFFNDSSVLALPTQAHAVQDCIYHFNAVTCFHANSSLKAHFYSRHFSTARKFSENIIVESSKFSTSKFFSDGKFVSANHILQNFLSVENFLRGHGPLYQSFFFLLLIHSTFIIRYFSSILLFLDAICPQFYFF
jgi:hypothetical protein